MEGDSASGRKGALTRAAPRAAPEDGRGVNEPHARDKPGATPLPRPPAGRSATGGGAGPGVRADRAERRLGTWKVLGRAGHAAVRVPCGAGRGARERFPRQTSRYARCITTKSSGARPQTPPRRDTARGAANVESL